MSADDYWSRGLVEKMGLTILLISPDSEFMGSGWQAHYHIRPSRHENGGKNQWQHTGKQEPLLANLQFMGMCVYLCVNIHIRELHRVYIFL
jgi:hypothetical protein